MNSPTKDLSNSGIRKAAILVACLNRAAADAVLEQLSPDQAQRVRQAVIILDDIPADEQRHVVDEFFQLGPQNSPGNSGGVELGGRLAARIGAMHRKSAGQQPKANGPHSKPFVRLREAEDEKLSRLLAGERPQTIALVLSHLTARQSAGVLARLQPNVQTEVVRRLVDLEETDASVLQEVEQALESRLSQQVHMQRRRVAGLEAVEGILDASDSDVRLQILDNVAARDRILADRLIPPPMEFDELADLDDATLADVVRSVEPQFIMPALFGALPEVSERILRFLPSSRAESLRRKLANPGPIRLSDVESARQQFAEIAARIVFARGFSGQGARFK